MILLALEKLPEFSWLNIHHLVFKFQWFSTRGLNTIQLNSSKTSTRDILHIAACQRPCAPKLQARQLTSGGCSCLPHFGSSAGQVLPIWPYSCVNLTWVIFMNIHDLSWKFMKYHEKLVHYFIILHELSWKFFSWVTLQSTRQITTIHYSLSCFVEIPHSLHFPSYLMSLEGLTCYLREILCQLCLRD